MSYIGEVLDSNLAPHGRAKKSALRPRSPPRHPKCLLLFQQPILCTISQCALALHLHVSSMSIGKLSAKGITPGALSRSLAVGGRQHLLVVALAPASSGRLGMWQHANRFPSSTNKWWVSTLATLMLMCPGCDCNPEDVPRRSTDTCILCWQMFVFTHYIHVDEARRYAVQGSSTRNDQ